LAWGSFEGGQADESAEQTRFWACEVALTFSQELFGAHSTGTSRAVT
jgi:hypothetical protein